MGPRPRQYFGIPAALALLAVLVVLAPGAAQAQKDKNAVTTIRVTVTVVSPKNQPVQGAGVVLRQESVAKGRIPKDPFNVEIHTDEKGKAIVQGFEPGVVLVQVISKDFNTWGQAFILSKPNEAVYIKLQPPQPQVTAFGKGGKKGGGGA